MRRGQPTELAALRTRFAELHDLRSAASLLWWDQNVCMPPAGGAARADAMATLERVGHEKLIDSDVGRLLEALEPYERDLDPESDDARFIARARRDHAKAARVPSDLAAAMAQEGALGDRLWVRARREDDFSILRDSLERQFELRRRYAACFPEAAHPFDVVLDDFEEGATVAEVAPLLEQLQAGLHPLVEPRSAPGRDPWSGRFPVAAQKALMRDVLLGVGFTDERFRLDEAAHPFSQSPGLGDHRLTTRYREDDLSWSLHATLHEFGHALYEAQVDPALGAGPLSRGVSLGVHESQSRLWENQVGRSLPFCRWLLPKLQAHFDAFDDVVPEELFRPLYAVQPSPVRTEADETTYNLHVVLRVELEIALMEGSLEVAALPDAWDEGMHRLLGIVPPSAAQGVLQDIHWAAGLIGYFATYTLGNLGAAQLWTCVRRDLEDVDGLLERGEFEPLREWLRENVHRHGRRHPPAELMRRVTGRPLEVGPLVAYLEARLADAGVIPAAA